NLSQYSFGICGQVIWRWWKISLRTVSGVGTWGAQTALFQGCFNYLERLSDQLLLHILSYLTFWDIGRLSQTSHKFKKLCDSKDLREQAVQSCCDDITPDMEILANQNTKYKLKCNTQCKRSEINLFQFQHCILKSDRITHSRKRDTEVDGMGFDSLSLAGTELY
uniref:F-box domain-containing protein n=1 Tax=Electrophorus electricus TaxID=8005 RepID=A0AAY5EGE6_ELEEL